MIDGQDTAKRAHDCYYDSGWCDYVTSLLAGTPKEFSLAHLQYTEGGGPGKIWGVPQSLIEQAYTDGWSEAKQARQECGLTVFLLNDLIKRMSEPNEEWYGTSFDEPIAIVRKVLADVQGKTS